VSPDWVENLKIEQSGEVHNSIKTALHWVRNVFTESINQNYGMEKMFFHHSPAKFQDTNNLSVVTFISYNNVGIMFPGDLETAGWQEFLKDQNFLSYLRRTNILIASHHGRESGYCKEVFDYCSPHTVIISDKSIVHDTQDHDFYSQHCSGLNFGNTLRQVLTTRNDGKITIEIPAVGNYTVRINQSY
jgi:beta-lactamase superfamily II metal-dependent hydrolase